MATCKPTPPYLPTHPAHGVHTFTPSHTPNNLAKQEYDKYDELHGQFWEALHVISQQELDEARKRDEADRTLIRANRAAAGGAAMPEESKLAVQERGLHPDVQEALRACCRVKLRKGGGPFDVPASPPLPVTRQALCTGAELWSRRYKL